MPPVQDYLSDTDSDPMGDAVLEGSRQANYDSGLATRPGTKAPKAPKAAKALNPLDNPEYKNALAIRNHLHGADAVAAAAVNDFKQNEGRSLFFGNSPEDKANKKVYPNALMAQAKQADENENGRVTADAINLSRQSRLLGEKYKNLQSEHDRIKAARTAYDAEHFIPLKQRLMDGQAAIADSPYTNGAGTISGGNNPGWRAPAQPPDYLAPTGDDWASERVAAVNAERENTGQKPLAPGSVSAGNFTEEWAPLRERTPQAPATDSGNDNNPPGDETRGGEDERVPDVLDPQNRAQQHEAMAENLRQQMIDSGAIPKPQQGSKYAIPGAPTAEEKAQPLIGFGDQPGGLFTIPRLPETPESNPVANGLVNSLGKGLSGLTTLPNLAIGAVAAPLGAAAATGSKLAKVGAGALSTYFGADMAKEAGGQAGKASVDLNNPDLSVQQKVESVADPLFTGGLGVLAALHGGREAMDVARKPIPPTGMSPGTADMLRGVLVQAGKFTPEQAAKLPDIQTHAEVQNLMREQPKADGSAPVDIGKRNPEISQGNGVATPAEQAMLAEQQRLVNEHLAAQRGEPNNALPQSETGEILQRQPQPNGETGGERGRVEQGQQGDEATQAGETGQAGQTSESPEGQNPSINAPSPEGERLSERSDVISSEETNNQTQENNERAIPNNEQSPNGPSTGQPIEGIDPSGRIDPARSGQPGLLRPDLDSGGEQPRGPQSDEPAVSSSDGPPAGNSDDGQRGNASELTTGIKNASVEDQQKERGNDVEPPREGETSAAQQAEASARLQSDPEAAGKLIADVAANPRQLDGPESVLVTHELTRIRNDRNVINKAVDAAVESGDPEAIKKAKAELDANQTEFDKAKDVAFKSGTKWSDVGRARQLELKEDYSPANLERRWKLDRVAAGKDFTPEELDAKRDEWKQQSTELEKRVAEAETARTKAEEESANARAEIAIRDIERGIQKEGAKKGPPDKGSVRQWIADRAAEAYERQKQHLGKTYANPIERLSPENLRDYAYITADLLAKGVDAGAELVKRFGTGISEHVPRILELAKRVGEQAEHVVSTGRDTPRERVSTVGAVKKRLASGDKLGDLSSHVRKIAEQHIREGKKGREDVLNATHETLREANPDITKNEVRDALSGYGKFKPLNPRETLAQLRDVAGQLQQVSKLEDMQKGQAPLKTGVERRIPSEEEKSLIKQVEAAKKKGGYTVTDPTKQLKSSTDAIAKSLDTQIKELQRQITMEEVFTPGKKGPISTPEIESKRAKVEQLKAERENVRDKLQPTPEPPTAHDQRLSALDKQIAELERQVGNREVFPKGTKEKESSPAIAAREAQLADLKARREGIRKEIQPGKEPPTPEEKDARKVAASIKAADKSIALLKSEINSGSAKLRTKASDAPTSLQLEAKRAEIDNLTAHRDALRKLAIPAKTPAEIAARDLAAYKARLASQYARNRDTLARHAAGDFTKPVKTPKEVVADKAAETATAAIKRQQDAINRGQEQDRRKNMSVGQKALGIPAKVRRFNVVSGLSTLGKVAAAGIARPAITLADTVAGKVLSKLPFIRRIAAGAPREGNPSLTNLAKGYAEGWKYTADQAKNVLKTGLTDAEVNAGQKEADPSLAQYVMNTHALAKLPAFATEYKTALQERAKGKDMSNPSTVMDVNNQAVADGLRAKLSQDNFFVKRYNMWLDSLDKAEDHPNTAKALAEAMRFLMPVVKVPSNFLSEAGTYTNLGLGLPRAAIKTYEALKKGVDTLTPDQRDSIMRHWKKGSVGAALMLYGYYNANNVGGYYQPGKRDEKLPKVGGVRLFGHDIPRWAVHAPILEPIHFGATIAHYMDAAKKKGEAVPSPLDGVLASASGFADSSPYVSGAENLTKAFSSKEEGTRARADLAKSAVIPRPVQEAAEYQDRNALGETTKRNPKGVIQTIESGIPYLRQKVPQSSYIDPTLKKAASDSGITAPEPGRPRPNGQAISDDKFEDYRKQVSDEINESLKRNMSTISRQANPKIRESMMKSLRKQAEDKVKNRMKLNQPTK